MHKKLFIPRNVCIFAKLFVISVKYGTLEVLYDEPQRAVGDA